MVKFFKNWEKNKDADGVNTICGEDAYHAIKSLRMKPLEQFVLCNEKRQNAVCKILKIEDNKVFYSILDVFESENELKSEITLYQSIPKLDKMDLIIQKTVELGVHEIVPVISARCISRPSAENLSKKTIRWQKIAKESAQQSMRDVVPKICESIKLFDVSESLKKYDLKFAFYELYGKKIDFFSIKNSSKIAVFIGPEGGYEKTEIEFFIKNGVDITTLGKRILRTETAAIAAVNLIGHFLD